MWRVAAIVGAVALVGAACAQNMGSAATTTNIDLTTTMVASVTTTATQPTTTSATATTTTTTAPPTTTTSTLPEDIGRPTGEIWLSIEGEFAPLGLVAIDRSNVPIATLSGRLVAIFSETIDDFQGAPSEVVFMELALGEYTNGAPFLVKFALGEPGDKIMESAISTPIRGSAGPGGEEPRPISEFVDRASVRLRLQRHSQIDVDIQTEDIGNRDQEYCRQPEKITHPLCRSFLEEAEHLGTNQRILELLQQGGIAPGEALAAGEFGWIFYEVVFYPPLIDYSPGGG